MSNNVDRGASIHLFSEFISSFEQGQVRPMVHLILKDGTQVDFVISGMRAFKPEPKPSTVFHSKPKQRHLKLVDDELLN